ncbi:MAG: hypothetical protein AB4426_20380 [Xenococcaceae cyanobacterium]
MAGGDKVDVVAAPGLECEHHLGDRFRFYLFPHALVADIPVLAVDAAQVAPTEEYGPRTFRAPQRIFLPVVGTETMNHCAIASAAHCTLGRLVAIDMTIAGAQIAIFQVLISYIFPFSQLARLQQGEVSWGEVLMRVSFARLQHCSFPGCTAWDLYMSNVAKNKSIEANGYAKKSYMRSLC